MTKSSKFNYQTITEKKYFLHPLLSPHKPNWIINHNDKNIQFLNSHTFCLSFQQIGRKQLKFCLTWVSHRKFYHARAHNQVRGMKSFDIKDVWDGEDVYTALLRDSAVIFRIKLVVNVWINTSFIDFLRKTF